MILTNIYWIITIWLATLLMGLISWPVSRIFFGKLSDHGYSISKIVGWIVISYAIFLSATLKILPLSLASLLLLIFIWALVNFAVRLKGRAQKTGDWNWKKAALVEISFLLLMGLWAFVRGHEPQIYEIERFMDFGFIQALFNSRWLPLYDIWAIGKTLNYYYFGHVMAYTILAVTRIPLVPGFFLLIAWLFALLGINVYCLGRDLFSLIEPESMRASTLRAASRASGFLAWFFVLIAGTWHTTVWFIQYAWSNFADPKLAAYFYPAPTRVIPGTITEMPFYSFIVADLHAHVWGLMIGIFVISLLFALWRDREAKLTPTNKYLWALAFGLGVAFLTSSWDIITLGGLSAAVIILKFWREPNPTAKSGARVEKSIQTKVKIFLCLLGLPIAAYLLALPWTLYFKAPVRGIALGNYWSPLWPWFSFWGAWVTVAVIFIARLAWLKWRKNAANPTRTGASPHIDASRKHSNEVSFSPNSGYLFFLAILASSALFLLAIEVAYMRDILKDGIWFRANTVFKVAIQVWLWLSLAAGPIAVWLLLSARKLKSRLIIAAALALFVITLVIYPLRAAYQANLQNKKFTGIESGLNWWAKKYPYDYEAFLFLADTRDKLPPQNRIKNIVEADGESYTDTSRFSVFLGWPTIAGWSVHEWTWRGDYTEVGARASEVREIYTGWDPSAAKRILNKYGIDYIIVGEVEKQRYASALQTEKITGLGKTVFDNKVTRVIEVKSK